jgi:hypothetical protein
MPRRASDAKIETMKEKFLWIAVPISTAFLILFLVGQRSLAATPNAVKPDLMAPGVSVFIEPFALARAFEAQKNQSIPENAHLSFKVDSNVNSSFTLANTKATLHLLHLRGHFKATWKKDEDISEDESVYQLYDAVFIVFDSQKKVLLMDQYFAEDGCDGDHIIGYNAKILYFKPRKEQIFFSLDRKMKGDSCVGDNFTRSWTDTSIYVLKDFLSRKLHFFVAFDKKENLAFFPDSDESYVSGQTYQRSTLMVEKDEKKESLEFVIKSVTLQGIEKPVTSKVTHKFNWSNKTEIFEESD